MKSHDSIGLDLGQARDSCNRPYILLGPALNRQVNAMLAAQFNQFVKSSAIWHDRPMSKSSVGGATGPILRRIDARSYLDKRFRRFRFLLGV